ncbi:HAMP domain-containing histidine kinase [Undibacterium jejuense]|uniref:histidine kinase n=1 Tax=Undibacterium jejuense TaxID=1344949 RepID=A0A923HK97_9BURK|nr:HAMP domain-containing sensor histidine kinase [Undibacterium jejuense]MBC3862384.1 HAMP domain-containing histidine kinase [Undibacterium jejuense]
MSDQIRQRSWTQRILPSSLLGRLSVVMVAGVMLTQFVGNAFWAAQMRKESQIEVTESSQHLAQSAASTIRFFMSPPPNFRSLIIQQFREMGGTRFYVNLNSAPITIKDIPEQALTALAKEKFSAALKKVLPNISKTQLNFTWPDDLVLSEDGAGIGDVPDRWVQHILVTKPNPAPILVLQVEMEPGHWLYLATLMPNPYFLDSNDPLSGDRVVLQALSLAAVLLLSILVVSWITRPLAALSEAASAFGNGESAPELPETGSREFVNTARAFSAMRERIARYIEDRERLFVSISHDLRTPIMRLKLRAELLDDDDIRSEFHDDLDELDMMVKGALQCVKDSDIYENPTEIRLDPLIGRMVRGVGLAGHQISFQESGLSVSAKPLALKRAIGNLLNNAIHYGKQVEISAIETEFAIEIQIRDHGPGVPEEALDRLFDPYVRLDHGRQQNQTGLGLGLSIARDIVQAHGGKLLLSNVVGGGLLACIQLPKHG